MTSKKTLGYLILACLTICATTSAQTTRSGSARNYASDSFEGFEAFDFDNRIPQKNKSFWYSVKKPTPAEQLTYGIHQEALDHTRTARKAYEALIREWPTTIEAPQAQLALAGLYEKTGKFDKAFDEYQYLIAHYASVCPYDTVLDRQFRIANHLLHNNTSMFGWSLSGTDQIRERFEQLVVNAPRSPRTPEIMLIIGALHVAEKERREAIIVYDALLNRFPHATEASTAAYLASKCRYELAMHHNYNETRCREAIAFLKAILTRMPNHVYKDEMTNWLKQLNTLLVEQNYQQAVFYDTRSRNTTAAQTAYRRFLTEFPDSTYVPQIKARLEAIEKGATPTN